MTRVTQQTLDRRTRILELRKQGMTWVQIGELYGVSRQRAHQMSQESAGVYRRRLPFYQPWNRHQYHRRGGGQRYGLTLDCKYCGKRRGEVLS